MDLMHGTAQVLGTLRADEKTAAWLKYLEDVGDPDFEVRLPSVLELPAVLVELAVPHEDVDDLVAMLPTRTSDPQLWWLLERCANALVKQMGVLEGPPVFPVLPESLGAIRRWFFIYVFLAVLPHVRAYHRARGIPEDICRLTLADLGRSMATQRRKFGMGGFPVASWPMKHFRGIIYQLGRLQFERALPSVRMVSDMQAAGESARPDKPVLAVHIPDHYGPLSPAACDDSFARAREFFGRYFPEDGVTHAVCHSWLLDEQLAEYLPAETNIVQFQRQFRPAFRPDYEDSVIIGFVFGRTTVALDDLPRRTSLQRAIIDHLRAGRHWYGGTGWLRL